MRLIRQIPISGLVLVFAIAIVCLTPREGAAEAFTLTATNVTMPMSSGIGVSKFTIQGIPLTGTINLACTYAGTPGQAKVPVCPLTPPVAYSVTAGGTLTGEVAFYPYGSAVPAGMPERVPRGGTGWLVMAGVLLLGVGSRKGLRGRLAVLLIGACGLLGAFAGLAACGGSGSGGTPGTYPFTITATNAAQPDTPIGAAVSTTISVTVQ